MYLRQMLPEDLWSMQYMAQQEGWVSDLAELRLHLSLNHDGCFTSIEDDKVMGGVMTFAYQAGGWIGNLIVDPEYRSKGVGRMLLKRALDHLSLLPTRFLCAAPVAVGLYSGYGFKSITKVNRWRCSDQKLVQHDEKMELGHILDMDTGIWHDDRSRLLVPFLKNRYCTCSKAGCFGFGNAGNNWVIGPWYSFGAISAADALREHMEESTGDSILVDVPSFNNKAGKILEAADFEIIGTTLLMYAGKMPKIDFDKLYGFTSMGSKG